MAAPLKDAEWLDWIAGLLGEPSRHTQAAAFPPDRYSCLLDELPLHLVPQWFFPSRQAHEVINQRFFLNPDCQLLPADEFPLEVESRPELLEGFARQGTIAWVTDRARGLLSPFWLGEKLESVVRGLHPDQPAPGDIPKNLRWLLACAGILIAPDSVELQRERWRKIVVEGRPRFQESGYFPVANLIHPFNLAALRRYYRHQVRSGAIPLGDGQSPHRYVAYNDSVARFFHFHIAKAVSDIAGEPVKPSYVYMASYRSGAELKKHTDREQCEFSVTLCVDFSPEPGLETSWPICLDTASGTTTVYQALGDGLVYRGTRVPHYRDVLGGGKTSTSIFFHYVPENFAGSLD